MNETRKFYRMSYGAPQVTFPEALANGVALVCAGMAVAALWTQAGKKAIAPILYLILYAEYHTTGAYSVFLTLLAVGFFMDDIVRLFSPRP